VTSELGARVPVSVADAILGVLAISATTPLARLSRETRRRLVKGVTEWRLEVTGSRGDTYAEATAGGVSLGEVDPATMASRRCPGLFLVGEILDVDGRLGGFNFQWAWASARAAASGLAGTAAGTGKEGTGA
jgi:predicted flavoprotein YhiN